MLARSSRATPWACSLLATMSPMISTGRRWIRRMQKFVEDYNGEVDRYRRAQRKQKKTIDVDAFVYADLLKWTHNLKQAVASGRYAAVEPSNFRRSLYRPFCKKWLFFDRLLNERV